MRKSLDRTPQLEELNVGDCMHRGILSCPADAPLGEVAGLMAKHRIHAVAVTADSSTQPVGVVSDLDVVAAVVEGSEPSALESAATEPLAVSTEEPIFRAAQLMAEHGVAHLIVLDAVDGHPVGIISTLDIAAVYAGARAG